MGYRMSYVRGIDQSAIDSKQKIGGSRLPILATGMEKITDRLTF